MSDNSRQNIENSVVDICLKYKSYNALVEENRHSAAELFTSTAAAPTSR